MKNTLKNRIMLFTVSYMVSFIVARIYRNKVDQERVMGLQMMADYNAQQKRLRIQAALEQEEREWRYYLNTRAFQPGTRIKDRVNEAMGEIVHFNEDLNVALVQWDGVEVGCHDFVTDTKRLILS